MYEDLMTRLRNWPRICVQYDGSVDQLHDEAAEAIEELSQLVSFYESAADGYWADICRIRGGGDA